MDYKNVMQHHIGNLRRAVGSDTSGKYSYIVSNDELTNAYLQMRNELGYPLMIDSKYRRAIVYNKQGIENKIQELINQSILSNIKLLEDTVAEDIVNAVMNQIGGINNIVNNGYQVTKSTIKKSSSALSIFASAMAKTIIGGIGKMIDEFTNYDD